ncbi:MAG: chromate efflux transporter [Flavobacteriales bacterium]|nr:chromate efflux transporter [Flavobacteriales bacterium]
MKESRGSKLWEVASVFFKLGCFAFGGPAAHIAMMEEEIVQKRKWMDEQHFLDLMGATNIIPGPNSTEMTMHCGHERAGIPGLFVAGICFIFPAVVLTGLLAFFYVEYGDVPEIAPFFQGIKPAVLAIIAAAVFKLGKKALKSTELVLLGILVLGLALFGFNEIALLLGAGALGMVYFSLRRGSAPLLFIPLLSLFPTHRLPSSQVFFIFLKVGAILYGSGYVLFAYLDAELVMKGLLSRSELVDAIAMGQFTPGPVLSTATFIGYQLSGWQGAMAASIGIFLPSFIFVMILNPLVGRLKKSLWLRSFLDSVNVAAVAVMAAVLLEMGAEVLISWQAILIAAISTTLVFLVKRKVNPIFIIIMGAVLGWLLNFI